MMPKKVLVALPPGLLATVDYMAETEYRTRSDLIREALRRYEQTYRESKGIGFDVQLGEATNEETQKTRHRYNDSLKQRRAEWDSIRTANVSPQASAIRDDGRGLVPDEAGNS